MDAVKRVLDIVTPITYYFKSISMQRRPSTWQWSRGKSGIFLDFLPLGDCPTLRICIYSETGLQKKRYKSANAARPWYTILLTSKSVSMQLRQLPPWGLASNRFPCQPRPVYIRFYMNSPRISPLVLGGPFWVTMRVSSRLEMDKSAPNSQLGTLRCIIRPAPLKKGAKLHARWHIPIARSHRWNFTRWTACCYAKDSDRGGCIYYVSGWIVPRPFRLPLWILEALDWKNRQPFSGSIFRYLISPKPWMKERNSSSVTYPDSMPAKTAVRRYQK